LKTKFIIKKDLINIIYKRLNKLAKKKDIKKSIDILIESIVLEFLNKNSISIKNFGTFSPYLFKGHNSYNVNNGEFLHINSFISIKFRPNYIFKKILESKRNFFKKT